MSEITFLYCQFRNVFYRTVLAFFSFSFFSPSGHITTLFFGAGVVSGTETLHTVGTRGLILPLTPPPPGGGGEFINTKLEQNDQKCVYFNTIANICKGEKYDLQKEVVEKI